MKTGQKINGTIEAWESQELGADVASAQKVSPEKQQEIEQALGLQMISIRLDKDLIQSFKTIGQFHGIGYQPLMRDALKRFVESEMKSIVTGMVQSQRELKEQRVKNNASPTSELNKSKKAA